MAVTPRSSSSRQYKSAGRCGLIAIVLTLMPAGSVLAQTAQPPAASKVPAAPPAAPQASGQTPVPAVPQPSTAQPSTASVLPPQPPPPEKRGFLNDFGNWWDKSVANFNAKIKYGQQQYDFDEGIMFFMSPGQVFGIEVNHDEAIKDPVGSYWFTLILYGTRRWLKI